MTTTQRLHEITGLTVDCAKLEKELVTVRNYSESDLLWVLVHAAMLELSATYSQLLRSFSANAPSAEAYRQLGQLKSMAEKAVNKRIENILANLPPVPVKTLSSKAECLPLKDTLVPSGYYLRSCKSNKQDITLSINGETKIMHPGSQTIVKIDDTVSAKGEGQIMRWQRMPAPKPATPAKAIPLPKQSASELAIAAVVLVVVAMVIGIVIFL